jgi:hypothetical protein
VVVLKSRGEMALLNMSGTGVYGMKSHEDLVCDGSNKCKASAAWLHQEGIIGSGRGIMRGDLPKDGSFRTSAECVRITVVRSAKWYPRPKALILGFIT